ncbi:uncharacterized protein TEOVI_000168100 [Trypanosoma equiperdum]|uniref:Uncharacterized protein n=1 Tax=Trypanosoma equiperdum TaxID=5694 RepID=A0A1G4ICW0_TRYEQ|nr:hypothetical protein, conserved [Trypanosoma equiperdum]
MHLDEMLKEIQDMQEKNWTAVERTDIILAKLCAFLDKLAHSLRFMATSQPSCGAGAVCSAGVAVTTHTHGESARGLRISRDIRTAAAGRPFETEVDD